MVMMVMHSAQAEDPASLLTFHIESLINEHPYLNLILRVAVFMLHQLQWALHSPDARDCPFFAQSELSFLAPAQYWSENQG